jgi:hypothetical protein
MNWKRALIKRKERNELSSQRLMTNIQCSVKCARPCKFDGSKNEPAGIFKAIVV